MRWCVSMCCSNWCFLHRLPMFVPFEYAMMIPSSSWSLSLLMASFSSFAIEVSSLWLVLKRKFLHSFHCILFLLFLKIICIWYSMIQQQFYESIGEIVLLVDDMYYLLHKVKFCCILRLYDWYWGGNSYIFSTVNYSCSFSK